MKSSKHLKKLVIVLFLAALASLSIIAPVIFSDDSTHPISSVHLPTEFNATHAYEDIRTQLEFGYRVPGTIEHNACAEWIRSQLYAVTDEVVTHQFSLPGPQGEPIYCQNILGKLNTNKSNIIIIGAHWDSRAIAEKDTINTTQPIPGANDGGSGVAVTLELARVFYNHREEFNSQIWFLFLDAEDQGGGGIADWYWAEGAREFSSTIHDFFDNSTETFSFFLLLDMVGGHSLQFMDELYSNNDLQQAVFSEGRELGYLFQFPKNPTKRYITDDHIYFRPIMPTLDLIIDFVEGPWTHHHTHEDNLDNIDIDSLKVTGRTVESFMYTYHGKSNWKKNWTVWMIIGSISGVGIVTIVSVLIGIRWKKKRSLGT
ncbi:MAG: M28 family peptidase [Candidatus Lokiarchaeota archaeon]|nr:M28 family peptidase [Candidatus Lokiarchaeota archaeon]